MWRYLYQRTGYPWDTDLINCEWHLSVSVKSQLGLKHPPFSVQFLSQTMKGPEQLVVRRNGIHPKQCSAQSETTLGSTCKEAQTLEILSRLLVRIWSSGWRSYGNVKSVSMSVKFVGGIGLLRMKRSILCLLILTDINPSLNFFPDLFSRPCRRLSKARGLVHVC